MTAVQQIAYRHSLKHHGRRLTRVDGLEKLDQPVGEDAPGLGQKVLFMDGP